MKFGDQLPSTQKQSVTNRMISAQCDTVRWRRRNCEQRIVVRAVFREFFFLVWRILGRPELRAAKCDRLAAPNHMGRIGLRKVSASN